MSEQVMDNLETVEMRLAIRWATDEDPHYAVLNGDTGRGIYFEPTGRAVEDDNAVIYGRLIIGGKLDQQAAAATLRMIADTLEKGAELERQEADRG